MLASRTWASGSAGGTVRYHAAFQGLQTPAAMCPRRKPQLPIETPDLVLTRGLPSAHGGLRHIDPLTVDDPAPRRAAA